MAGAKMIGFVRRHSFPALFGVAMLLLFINSGDVARRWWNVSRDAVPVTEWFEVYTLLIEDAAAGEDPRLNFRRDIKQDVSGTFNSSIFKYAGPDDGLGTMYCQGNGSSDYGADRILPPKSIALSWLMNREDAPCRFVPGLYKNVTTWTFTSDGYTPKRLRVESNFFRVTAK